MIVRLFSLFISPLWSDDIHFYNSQELEPNDYLFRSYIPKGDPVFNKTKSIQLDVDLGITSDCGKISIKNTLKASLQNLLETKEYFGEIGQSILGSAPMLLTCYASPTWCAILKHAQLKANFLAQLRLNQCKAINRFVDMRANEYYQERSNCVQKSIHESDGNFEKAMESCSNNQGFDMQDWSGGSSKSQVNKLIESTAKWANMSTKRGKEISELTKSLIGDTIIKAGKISVDFGPKKTQISPRTYLLDMKQDAYTKLCKKLLPKLIKKGGYHANIYSIVSYKDLEDISKSSKNSLDHQTILSLLHFPYEKRQLACKKLADAIGRSIYSEDMGQAMDFVSSTMTSNPHLPMERKKEVELKRTALKDQIEVALSFENEENQSFNYVLKQINQDGREYIDRSTKKVLVHEKKDLQSQKIQEILFDHADGIN